MTETAVDETTADETAADETAEEEDTLGAEITAALDEEDDDKSVSTLRSLKTIRSSIASTMRRFSMGSKLTGLNWKSSQYSINTQKTDDYLEPVQRRSRKPIGKTVVREDHSEFIKEHCLFDMSETKELMAHLLFFDDKHVDFPEQPLQNMMDVVSIEMDLLAEYIDMINDRIERLGYSPTATPSPSPMKLPSPGFFEKMFCYHKYAPSDSDASEGGSDQEEPGPSRHSSPEKEEEERSEEFQQQSEERSFGGSRKQFTKDVGAAWMKPDEVDDDDF